MQTIKRQLQQNVLISSLSYVYGVLGEPVVDLGKGECLIQTKLVLEL